MLKIGNDTIEFTLHDNGNEVAIYKDTLINITQVNLENDNELIDDRLQEIWIDRNSLIEHDYFSMPMKNYVNFREKNMPIIYDKEMGINKENIFVYLWNKETLFEEMKNDVPSCQDVEKIIEFLKELTIDPKNFSEQNIDQSVCLWNILENFPTHSDNFYNGVKQQDLTLGEYTVYDFFQNMLAATDSWELEPSLIGTFTNENNVVIVAEHFVNFTKKLDAFTDKITKDIEKEEDCKNFQQECLIILQHLEKFVKDHKETLGGAMLYVEQMKKEFAEKFGSREAPQYTFGRSTSYGSISINQDVTQADCLLFVNAHDFEGMNEEGIKKAFDTMVSDYKNIKEKQYFTFNIITEDGEQIEAGDPDDFENHVYIGKDFEKNGLYEDLKNTLGGLNILDETEETTTKQKTSQKRTCKM